MLSESRVSCVYDTIVLKIRRLLLSYAKCFSGWRNKPGVISFKFLLIQDLAIMMGSNI